MFHWPFLLAARIATARSDRLARVGGFAPYWLVRRVAEARLVRTLRHVYRHNSYQRERWQAAGIRRGDLRSAKVMPRIPFLDRDRLTADPKAFFCVPEDELVGMISTSGTTGAGKRIYLTRDDIARQVRMIGAHLRRLPGASRVLLIMNPAAQPGISPALIGRRGAEMAGMFSLSLPTRELPGAIDLLCEYRLDTIVASPTRAHQLTLETDGDPRRFGVKYFLLSGEPWGETQRRVIEEAWGAKALDVYGINEAATGIASECAYQTGLHVAEINQWIEIVDPDTGDPVPDGAEGEIVLTTLSRRGMPLVRYRVRDLAKLEPPGERCPCGMNLRKLSRIRGRVDHMVILGGGHNIFPSDFDDALLGVAGVTDYQIVFEKNGYRDVLNLDVETDLTGDPLRKTMIDALMTVQKIAYKIANSNDLDFGRIRAVGHGSLSDGRNKTVRIIDNRT